MKLHRLLLLGLFALLPGAFTTPGQQQAPSSRGWQRTQKTDAAREPTATQFSLPGKFLTRPQKDPGDPPALVVVCKPHASKGRFSAASVNVGAPLDIEYVEPAEIKAGTSYFPKVSVRYRLDDGRETKERWTPGTDKTSASIPKAALEKVLRARTVQIKVQEYRGGEITTQFDIPDSTLLATTCNLPAHQK